jgi:hypothetical protein
LVKTGTSKADVSTSGPSLFGFKMPHNHSSKQGISDPRIWFATFFVAPFVPRRVNFLPFLRTMKGQKKPRKGYQPG